jgi:hypothetical protein
MGGMNVLRLVCKRLMRLVESYATRLSETSHVLHQVDFLLL